VNQNSSPDTAFSKTIRVNTCAPNRNGPHCFIEFRPNDLASPRSRVGLTTFLQISNQPVALARGLLYTCSEGGVLWRKER
jgi:hypothetical protein